MKPFLENALDLAQNLAGKITRAINPPLSHDAKPLDLQQAILEAIEARTQPAGGGRRQMPDGYVAVRVIAKDAAEERAMRVALDGIRDLAAARLRELQCRVPQTFRVDVAYLAERPQDWRADQPLAIDFGALAPAARAGSGTEVADAAQPDLILTILRGRASAESYTLREPAIHVGRSEAPVDDRGRARRNHVAFSEGDDAHSRTVGRGHCEIRYDRAGGEYRIFDERSANGTRIVRGGQVIEVPAQDPFGIAIRTGDELQFGTAAARVEIRPPE